ncbi:hypothetical protein C1N80_01205 [Brachybacterium sp. SGAir0954]|uniref:hypothetical protein n=1 Tax=Brachybacterium sp. SGAir0954 TaxID=2571029 RepID=UPI0010CD19FA|nr:hypothetical protein [Brachybacterium sp. SGAir0954]QCR52333.1 hypothetical protein C1N80_01205 [Brachybacterium sp. SGAir0954]
MKTADLDAAARSLDPAPPAARPQRARADLESILATPRTTPRRVLAAVPPRRGRRVRRFALAAVVAGVLGVGAAAGLGALRPTTAAASWTAAGSPAAPDSAGAQQCLTWWSTPNPETGPVEPRLRVQEQRGDTTLAIGEDGDGDELLCLATLVPGQEPVGGTTSALEPPGAGEVPADGAIAVVVDTAFSSAEAQNGWQPSGHTAVAGHVGDQVESMVLETSAGPVEASIDDGLFLAWWPITDDGDPHPTPEATLTLEDGTTRTVQLSAP